LHEGGTNRKTAKRQPAKGDGFFPGQVGGFWPHQNSYVKLLHCLHMRRQGVNPVWSER
jgi:hypothetical protein